VEHHSIIISNNRFFTSFFFCFPPPKSFISETQTLFLPGAFILHKKQPFPFDPAFFLLSQSVLLFIYFLNTQSSEDFTNNIIISVFLNHATSEGLSHGSFFNEKVAYNNFARRRPNISYPRSCG